MKRGWVLRREGGWGLRREGGWRLPTTVTEAPEKTPGWRWGRRWLLEIGLFPLQLKGRRESAAGRRRESMAGSFNINFIILLSSNPSHPSLIQRLKKKVLTSH